MSNRLKTTKLSLLFWAGIVIAASFPLLSIASYALVATFVGESRLENSNGLTALGVFSQTIPLLLGFGLIAADVVIKPNVKSIWKAVTIAGLSMGVVGLVNILGKSSEQIGANIGAGILIITSIMFIAAGITLKIAKK